MGLSGGLRFLNFLAGIARLHLALSLSPLIMDLHPAQYDFSNCLERNRAFALAAFIALQERW